MTGHAEGVITVNIAEADDPERERRRATMHEPYRTLLGHMRHEIGHYYWDRLIAPTPEIDEFRSLFGDERTDYAAALRTPTTSSGAPADWQERFVSAYASSHPWEDWAETWAQYLHMVDTLETAAACGLSLTPRRRDEPTARDDTATRVAATGGLYRTDRQLVSADIRTEQPESRARAPRCLPVRPVTARGGQTEVRRRRRRTRESRRQRAGYLRIVACSVSTRYFRCAVISCSTDTPGGKSTALKSRLIQPS